MIRIGKESSIVKEKDLVSETYTLLPLIGHKLIYLISVLMPSIDSKTGKESIGFNKCGLQFT